MPMESCVICYSTEPPLIRCGVCDRVFCNNFTHRFSHMVQHLRQTGHESIKPISDFHIPPDALYCDNCETKTITDLGFLPKKGEDYSGIICCINCRMHYEHDHDVFRWRTFVSTHIDPCYFPGFEGVVLPEENLLDGRCIFTDYEGYHTPLPNTEAPISMHLPLDQDDRHLFSFETYDSSFYASLAITTVKPQGLQRLIDDMRRQNAEENPNRHILDMAAKDNDAWTASVNNLTKQATETRARQQQRRNAYKANKIARQEVLANIVLRITHVLDPKTTNAITARGYPAMVMWAFLDGIYPGFEFSTSRDQGTAQRSFDPKSVRCHILSHFYCRRKLHYFHYILPILALERLVTQSQLEENQVPVTNVQFRCLRGKWSTSFRSIQGLATLPDTEWEVLISLESISQDIKVYTGENFILKVLDYPGEVPVNFTFDSETKIVEIPLLCKSVHGTVAFFVHQENTLKTSVPFSCVTCELSVNNSGITEILPLTTEMATEQLKFTTEASLKGYKHSHFISRPALQYEIIKCDNDATYKRHISAITRLCAYNQSIWRYVSSDRWNYVLNIHKALYVDSQSEHVRLYAFTGLMRFILLADYCLAHAFIDLYTKKVVSIYGTCSSNCFASNCSNLLIETREDTRKSSKKILPLDRYSKEADPLAVPEFFHLKDHFRQWNFNFNILEFADKIQEKSVSFIRSERRHNRENSSSLLTPFSGDNVDAFQVLSFAAESHGKRLSTIPWETPYRELSYDNFTSTQVDEYTYRFASLMDGITVRGPEELTLPSVMLRSRCFLPPILRSQDSIDALIDDLSAYLHRDVGGIALNSSQKNVLQQVLSAPLSLVQGPPGCGKTFIGACLAWIFSKVYGENAENDHCEDINVDSDDSGPTSRRTTIPVLICCPSNTAAESLTLSLESFGLIVVRVVSAARQRLAEYQEITDTYADRVCLYVLLEDIIANVIDSPPQQQISATSENVRKITNSIAKKFTKDQFKRMHDHLSMQRRKDVNVQSSQDVMDDIARLINNMEDEIIASAQVVVCTCSTSYDPRLSRICFSSLIVDESTQTIEPDIICAIGHGCSHVTLIGDHKQLGPIVTTNIARLSNFNVSLYERLQKAGLKPHSLKIQYRMHPALSEFPSNTFYNGLLQNGVTREDRQLVQKNSTIASFPWPIPSIPTFFWHVQGIHEVGFGTSLRNDTEIMCVEAIISQLMDCYEIKQSDIGVVTPYDYQKCQLETQLLNAGYSNIFVNSIDAFQGHEKEVIIFSTVRSGSNNAGIGFLKDHRRMNVALTRCRCALIIVGNASALAVDLTWRSLVKHYHNKELLVTGESLDSLVPITNLDEIIHE